MKVNQNRAILTDKVLLVPYEAHHVPKYHSWMQDPGIQEATASEPLTLEEEYENQLSWRLSHDKLTFILCAPPTTFGNGNTRTTPIRGKVDDADEYMIGDINLFLYPHEEAQDHAGADTGAENDWITGEVDIMVAEKNSRGRGVGKAAVTSLLCYMNAHLADILTEHGSSAAAGGVARRQRVLELKDLMVKIGEKNMRSRKLFEKLGFEQKGPVNYFGEVEMSVPWDRLKELAWWDGVQNTIEEVEYQLD